MLTNVHNDMDGTMVVMKFDEWINFIITVSNVIFYVNVFCISIKNIKLKNRLWNGLTDTIDAQHDWMLCTLGVGQINLCFQCWNLSSHLEDPGRPTTLLRYYNPSCAPAAPVARRYCQLRSVCSKVFCVSRRQHVRRRSSRAWPRSYVRYWSVFWKNQKQNI